MLGSLARQKAKKITNAIGSLIAISKLPPNVFTILAILPASITAYLFAHSMMEWGLFALIITFLWDAIDGAVARAQNKKTLFGNYLDAMIDKYTEIIIYLGLFIAGYALESFLIITGSLILSYAKPRTAIVIPIDNHDWPAIGERLDRVILLVVAIVISILLPAFNMFGSIVDSLSVFMFTISAIIIIGGIQRIFYAKKLISKYNKST